jgi:electron transport complex protein RnfD
MANKIMLWPSARSKFLKDDNMKLIYNILHVFAIIMIVLNWYMYGFMYGLKLLLMIELSVLATVEIEILFYTHDKEIDRKEAKNLIQKSYPKLTALLYVLLIPIGTPLWLTVLGAVLATLLGKLLFGGFHHMVFHSSLVGVIFVTLGWPQLVDSVAFMTSFDNYLIDLIFGGNFFQNTLSLGNLYDPTLSTFEHSLVWLQGVAEGTNQLGNATGYGFFDTLVGIVPGIIGSGLLVLIAFSILIGKKAINYIIPVTMMVSFLITGYIITLSNGYDLSYPLYSFFMGSFLFVAVFITTDPITTPIDTKGKIIFGVIAGSLTMIIRHAAKYEEGVYFATLFMMMLTPMLNQVLKSKPAPKKKPVKKTEVA